MAHLGLMGPPTKSVQFPFSITLILLKSHTNILNVPPEFINISDLYRVFFPECRMPVKLGHPLFAINQGLLIQFSRFSKMQQPFHIFTIWGLPKIWFPGLHETTVNQAATCLGSADQFKAHVTCINLNRQTISFNSD